jgi:hypothetical protein
VRVRVRAPVGLAGQAVRVLDGVFSRVFTYEGGGFEAVFDRKSAVCGHFEPGLARF